MRNGNMVNLTGSVVNLGRSMEKMGVNTGETASPDYVGTAEIMPIARGWKRHPRRAWNVNGGGPYRGIADCRRVYAVLQ